VAVVSVVEPFEGAHDGAAKNLQQVAVGRSEPVSRADPQETGVGKREQERRIDATSESVLARAVGLDDIAEYIARSLAYFRDEPYNGQAPDLFTREAIEDIHEQTGGNPREVRIDCRELFTRAAFVWYRTGQDIDRIQVTPELRNRRFGMGY